MRVSVTLNILGDPDGIMRRMIEKKKTQGETDFFRRMNHWDEDLFGCFQCQSDKD